METKEVKEMYSHEIYPIYRKHNTLLHSRSRTWDSDEILHYVGPLAP